MAKFGEKNAGSVEHSSCSRCNEIIIILCRNMGNWHVNAND